jgi:lycopene beta-cyclase
MIRSGHAVNKKILLVDRDAKQSNDRTWCFWEREPGPFEEIVHRSWQTLLVNGPDGSQELSIKPYSYKLVRGADFYRHCLGLVDSQKTIAFRQASIREICNGADVAIVELEDGTRLTARYVFNSLFTLPQPGRRSIRLLQHFRGWLIQTDAPVFDPPRATLMDFQTGQSAGTSFFYVMPFSETLALVEYTLFSPALLAEEAYEDALREYIGRWTGATSYTILEKEAGVIPMTNHRFERGEGRIRNIGTAGGQTKPSSGYTFRFIQKECAAIIDTLERTGHPFNRPIDPKRFRFYDDVLLSVLHHRRMPGSALFLRLFRKNRPEAIMRFLDNESTAAEEASIISSLPISPFARAALWTGGF